MIQVIKYHLNDDNQLVDTLSDFIELSYFIII